MGKVELNLCMQPYLEKELGKGSVELLKSIKKTMDPQNILVSWIVFRALLA